MGSAAPLSAAAINLVKKLCAVVLLSAVASSPAYSGGVGGKELQARIAVCPDTRENLLIAPILGSIAAATASNLAGAAVESVINYLTQVRASTSQASLVLEGKDVSDLFGGYKCLYVYLPTRELGDYLKASSNWQAKKSITANFVNQIASRNLTRFFAVLYFDKPVDAVDQAVGATSFFRPIVQMWHFSRFIDSGCPLFRSCTKRDVVAAMELSYPRAANSDSRQVRSIPLAVALSGSTASEVGIAMTNPESLSWFSLNATSPLTSNLRFSITETSKPGALASALGSAITGSKPAIQQTAERFVYISPDAKSDLQKAAFDEYSNYINLYNKAKSASEGNMSDPGSRNAYAIIKDQLRTQLQKAKAAWSIAGVSASFSELPPLPVIP